MTREIGVSRDLAHWTHAQPEEVAQTLACLASPEARSVNGHVLVVDNGMQAGMFSSQPA